MELPLKKYVDCEVRSVIRCATTLKKPLSEIHSMLRMIYGEECMSIQMVRQWMQTFREGRDEVHDMPRADQHVNLKYYISLKFRDT